MGTIILQLLLLGLILFSLLARKSKLFLLLVTVQVLVYDVFSVYSDEAISRWIRWPAKGWQELIFVVALVQMVIRRQSFSKWLLLFIVPAASGLAVAFLSGQAPGQIIQGFRIFLMLPLSLYLLMESRIFSRLSALIPAAVLLAFSALSVVYSFWQNQQFSGDLRLLWFYDFVNKIHPVELARFNYIRNGGLRATGFFISPLVQSAVLGFSALIAIYLVRAPKKSITAYVLPGMLLIVFVAGLYLCRTRIGWVIFGGGLISWYLGPYLSDWKKTAAFLVPGLLVFFTFAWLLSGFSSEPSANGRLSQYAYLIDNFRFWGFGFGHPLTMTVFDSLIISSVFLFGFFAIFYLLIPLLICARLNFLPEASEKDKGGLHTDFFLLPPFAAFSSMILYMMVFQFTNGGPVISLYYWFAFIFLSGVKFRDATG